jgi:hypothetical protein
MLLTLRGLLESLFLRGVNSSHDYQYAKVCATLRTLRISSFPALRL